jgi:hypothetical protein
MAQCVWERPIWVTGEGPYASVSYCQTPSYPERTITVMLHADEAAARRALEAIDSGACGGGCCGPIGHALVRLVLPSNEVRDGSRATSPNV